MRSMELTTPRRRALTVRTNIKSEEEGDSSRTSEMVNGGEQTAAAEEEAEEPLSPAARLFHEPNFNCYIVAMMGFACTINVAVVRDGLDATLVRHPRFSSVLVSSGGKTRWVRTKVDVANHIITPDLDQKSPNTNDQLVEDYVASLSNGPGLNPSRPLWDLHLLNVPTSSAAATAVLRIHHSVGDGVSLMSLLLACTRKASDPSSVPSLPESSRRPRRRESNVKLRLWAMMLAFWAGVVLLWNSLVDILMLMATALFLRDTNTPLMGTQGVEHRPKRFVHRIVSLDDIKAVKNTLNCTINDVLIGITSAGLSRYLKRRCDENKSGKEESFSTHMRLRSSVIVNLRPTPGIQDLAEMMDKGGEVRWGNWFGYMLMPIPIATHDDPLEFVRRGKSIADRKKNSLEAVFSYNSAYLIVKLFGIKAATWLCHRILRNSTFSFSNVVGPVEEIAFYDHPLVYIAPSVYGHPHAVTLHFQSFANKMIMVLAVDESAIPDPHQLLEGFVESFQLMKDAANVKLDKEKN